MARNNAGNVAEMVESVEDERISRLYVRNEHVPFPDSRFRNLCIPGNTESGEFRSLLPATVISVQIIN